MVTTNPKIRHITDTTATVTSSTEASKTQQIWYRIKVRARRAWFTIKKNIRIMKEAIARTSMTTKVWAMVVTSAVVFMALLGPVEGLILILYFGAIFGLCFGMSWLISELLFPV